MTLQRQIDRLVAHQAAEWYEIVRLGNPRQYARFVRWVSESPRHMEAFLSIAGEAGAMRDAFGSGTFDLQSLIQQASSNTLPMRTPAATPPFESRLQVVRGRPWLWAAAASVLVTVTTLWLVLAQGLRLETDVGEQRVVPLADGSVLNLNAESRVDVQLSKHARDIELTRGEVLFKVAPDKARPFRVHTPRAIVEAVGTQFNVYVRGDGTATVAVVEGKVKVIPTDEEGRAGTTISARSAPAPGEVALVAGQGAHVAQAGEIERQDDANISDAVAWQQRKLIFKRTPLVDIAAEFNRYNRALRLRVENLPADAFIYSGAFDADDPGSLADLLAREPDLIVQRGQGEIVIRARR